MENSAAVAGLLWDSWLPASVRKLIASALPGGEEDAGRYRRQTAVRPVALPSCFCEVGCHEAGKYRPRLMLHAGSVGVLRCGQF
ncbi:hypothetical protein [Streptomyces sp. NPDC058394]|uniref:hypothetical protein n=1 Tax=Streptomyces sp. NPDC058394 TaxID=3346477 RepID=UPI0036593D16